MAIQLRQICLVAEKLQPVVEDLTDILGINPCYIDPGVGAFGLENTLMAVGKTFWRWLHPFGKVLRAVVISNAGVVKGVTW